MKIATVLITHFTYGWTQHCIQSFLANTKHSLIVFDNNPPPNKYYRNTRKQAGKKQIWNQLCQLESQYIRQCPRTHVIDVPKPKDDKRLFTHGEVLDLAFRWSKAEGFDSILHIEPDCLVSGSEWIREMQEKLETKWAVGKKPYMNRSHGKGIIICSLCPTLWRIQEILDLSTSFEKDGRYNTGQKILESCHNLGQLDVVNGNDFKHFWHGSRCHHPDVFKTIKL